MASLEAKIYTPILREGVLHKHLQSSLVYTYFPSFSLENKLFGRHQTSFLPFEALEFSELKTPLVYTFCPSNLRGGSKARKKNPTSQLSLIFKGQRWARYRGRTTKMQLKQGKMRNMRTNSAQKRRNTYRILGRVALSGMALGAWRHRTNHLTSSPELPQKWSH